jgi:hypothetical protein
LQENGSLSPDLVPLSAMQYIPLPFKTRCIALLLDASTAIQEPFLTIDDDDLLRIGTVFLIFFQAAFNSFKTAFWESPCAVLRLGMSYKFSDRIEVSLSMNTEAQRILGYSSHAELDQLQQDFAKATSVSSLFFPFLFSPHPV